MSTNELRESMYQRAKHIQGVKIVYSICTGVMNDLEKQVESMKSITPVHFEVSQNVFELLANVGNDVHIGNGMMYYHNRIRVMPCYKNDVDIQLITKEVLH